MKIRTQITGGKCYGCGANHNATMKVKTKLKAGRLVGNHNSTRVPAMKIRTKIRAGLSACPSCGGNHNSTRVNVAGR